MNENDICPIARRPENRVLRIIILLFTTGWFITLVPLVLLGSPWQAYAGSAILFVGLAVCWSITVFVLRRKNPKYVAAMLDGKPVE